MPCVLPGLFLLPSASAVALEHFVSGFTHILPDGADHLLFILALFFLTRKPTDLLLQLTLFTLAHSLTLGLSLYGLISLPETLVEIAIALSIVYVAAENIRKDTLSQWRPSIVFASGLVHGLGFAHNFPLTSVGDSNFLTALLSFNMGIEFGQLAVVGIAYAAVAAWWRHARYRNYIAQPASVIIAAFGLFWLVERAL